MTRVLELDASKWRSAGDFYQDILAVLGAPDWHGNSIDGLIDSIVWGGINKIEPPYTIHIKNMAGLDENTENYIQTVIFEIKDSFREYEEIKGNNIGVNFEITK